MDANTAIHDTTPGGPRGHPVPIAVVGMGWRGPGDAYNVEAFYKLLNEAKEARAARHSGRWNHDAFYHPDSTRKGTSNVEAGHYIKEDLSLFDAPFFKMTESEAATLDPQQRLLLETCYEALESAGVPISDVVGSNTSVFVGTFGADYTDLLQRDPDSMPIYQATNSGYSRAIISNRLSHFYDLRGTSVTVDTACSGGLTAFHLACQSIRTGDARQAIVGGSSLILHPDQFISLSAMRFLSPDGRCYSFDSRANGYARGEGVGCLFLKRLDDALAHGDPIRAVVRMTGSNQDGRTPGISFPSQAAQIALIRSVYERAGLDPADTSYVEAHGTGTQAGDPIETSAIAEAMTSGRGPDKGPLLLGSVKANIGHLEAASGVAALVKCVLMLENQTIFPNRNLETVNPRIKLDEWKLKIPTTPQPWEASSGVHRLSINSFGYGGTNAHAILENAEDFLAHQASSSDTSNLRTTMKSLYGPGLQDSVVDAGSGEQSKSGNPYQMLTITGFDEHSTKKNAASLSSYLKSRLAVGSKGGFFSDLVYTLNNRRSQFTNKIAVASNSIEDLIDVLGNPDKLQVFKVKPKEKSPRIGYVFTGQGAQWATMGMELMDVYPIYSEVLHRCQSHLKSIGAGWDLIDELSKDAKTSQIGKGKFSQPLCTALQLGLVELLRSWGIHPTAVTGHSSGEIAAAYTAGAISLEDAIASAYYRGVVSDRVARAAEEGTAPPGSMMAASLSVEEALGRISQLQSGYATVACHNSPSSVTISGDVEAITDLQSQLEAEGTFARKLIIEAAYHSRHMTIVEKDYLESMAGMKVLQSNSNDVKFFSSVTGKRTEVDQLGPQYWVDNMLGRVEFASSLKTMVLESDVEILVELGPHSALAGPIKQILQGHEKLKTRPIAYESALVRKSSAAKTAVTLAAKLSNFGVPVDITTVNEGAEVAGKPQRRGRNVVVDLPPYAWNKSRSYWAESRLSKEYRNRAYPRLDLLGRPELNFNPLDGRWRNFIRGSEIPWIRDHRIQSNVVYPAAGFISMAIEAAKQQATLMKEIEDLSAVCYKLREIVIGQALMIPEGSADDEVEVSLSMKPYSHGTRASSASSWREFTVYSVTEENQWTEHCRGLISVEDTTKDSDTVTTGLASSKTDELGRVMTEAQAACTTGVNVDEFYEHLRTIGLDYGPTFANMKTAYTGTVQGGLPQSRCLADIAVPDIASIMPGGFQYPHVLHPAILDAVFHSIFPAVAAVDGSLKDAMVPTFIESLDIFAAPLSAAQPGDNLKTVTSVEKKDIRSTQTDITVMSGEVGAPDKPQSVVQLRGMTLTRLSNDVGSLVSTEAIKTIAHNIRWEVDVDDIKSATPIWRGHKQVSESTDPADSTPQILRDLSYQIIRKALHEIPADSTTTLGKDGHLAAFRQWAATLLKNEERPPSSNGEVSPVAESQLGLGPEWAMLMHIDAAMPSILAAKQSWQSLIIDNVLLDDIFDQNSELQARYDQIGRYLNLRSFKDPSLKVLEVGVGAGWPTGHVLQAMGSVAEGIPRFEKYHVLTSSEKSQTKLQERLKSSPNASSVSFAAFEDFSVGNSDAKWQGLEPASFDVLVCSYLSLATAGSIAEALRTLRELLAPGGVIILLEPRRDNPINAALFGTHPSSQECRDGYATILADSGFSDCIECHTQDSTWDISSLLVAQRSPVQQITAADQSHSAPILVIGGSGESSDSNNSLLSLLVTRLSDAGLNVRVSTLEKADPTDQLCVVLWELQDQNVLSDPKPEQFAAVKHLFLRSRGILSVVQSASSRNPILNSILGWSRTVRSEVGDTPVLTLDVEEGEDAPETAEAISSLLSQHFLRVATKGTAADTEYKLVGGRLMIPRLVPDKATNQTIDSAVGRSSASTPKAEAFYQPGRPLRMEVGTPGLLDTIHFVDDEEALKELDPDSVEIEVKAVGLNFRDVMMALGQITVDEPGGECSGIITALGSNTKNGHLAVGDRVSCVHLGTFCNVVRSDARLVQKLPHDMTYETGASLPVVFCTAMYSVFNVANLRKGETVLIHAASGGLGQALIQLCQFVGAEVFITVGTPEKKALVMERFGIPEDHIFSSREPTSFYQGVVKATSGRGVDVIMNSLAGEGLRLSWSCIAPFGRFIELGKRDIFINTRLDMAKFAKNVSFTAVDLVDLIRARPAVVAGLWADCMARFHRGEITAPWPIATYGFASLKEAFQMMQSGRHTGKLVAVPEPGELVKVIPAPRKGQLFKADGTYLIAGGLGGLGRAIGEWMVRNGARNLVLCSRSGDTRPEAKKTIRALQDAGATVQVYACDVAEASQITQMVKGMEDKKMPPVRGIIQSTMVLRDTLLEKLTVDDFKAVCRPKIQGTQNLHSLVPNAATKDLDFFIMLSSVSGIIGNATQGAYAAANTFMDGFAGYRRSLGLHAVSIDLGVMEGVGYLAENTELLEAMRRQGFEATTEAELMGLLQAAVSGGGQIVTGLGRWNPDTSLGNFAVPLFAHFRRLGKLDGEEDEGRDGAKSVGLRELLKAAKSTEEGAQAVRSALVVKTSNLGMIPEENIDVTKPIGDYGIDSLVAVEMRNWVFRETDYTVPVLELMAKQPLEKLALKIAERSPLIK